ncbi:MAG: HAMP domain-containing histidine kinase [Methylotenera sp.]|nr:HAMP domain-containing histidine kinase [Oligoflexia bacterium]
MIRDLLDANRIKAGEGIPLAIQPCQLDKVVQSTLTDLTRFHGPRFELRNQSGTVQGFWDCAGLTRVIENLAVNAVKYGHTNTSIILRLEQDAQGAELSVHNHGPAIPPEDLKTLFDPYRRTVSAMNGGQKGWGIGLTLVKGITDAHRGTVHVESSLENGTTFRVRLPRDSRS